MQKAGFSFLNQDLKMAPTPFSKPACTPEQLLTKWKSQGLVVQPNDESLALAYIRYVGGYRLKGYWVDKIDPVSKRFPAGYTFQTLIDHCEFDRELRAATISAIDRLEVAIRSVMANYLSLKHSPHWFLQTNIFKPTRSWGVGQLINKIESEVGRVREKRFVKHYFVNHDEPYLPPSWAVSECVSFGLWSRTYSILRDINDKKAISMRFGVDQPEVFTSWIHTLTVVRNVAAHHGQFLQTRIGVSPSNYRTAGIKFQGQNLFFSAATVIYYLLEQTKLPHRWKSDLEAIFLKYPSVDIKDLGFPPDWKARPGWS